MQSVCVCACVCTCPCVYVCKHASDLSEKAGCVSGESEIPHTAPTTLEFRSEELQVP